MKIEICRKVTDLGKERQRTLVYYLTAEIDADTYESPVEIFGVGICKLETGEEKIFRDVTSVRSRAEELVDLLATNFVTPVSLEDVICDWLP